VVALNTLAAHVGTLVNKVTAPSSAPATAMETPSCRLAKRAFDHVKESHMLSPKRLAYVPLVFHNKTNITDFLNFDDDDSVARALWLEMQVEEVMLERAAKKRRLQLKADVQGIPSM
jgi:hypothetical protein